MKVLKAAEVASNDDQVHAALVLDVEVLDGRTGSVDDAKADRCVCSRLDPGLIQDQPEPALGDGQPGNYRLGPGRSMLIAPGPGCRLMRLRLVPLVGARLDSRVEL